MINILSNSKTLCIQIYNELNALVWQWMKFDFWVSNPIFRKLIFIS